MSEDIDIVSQQEISNDLKEETLKPLKNQGHFVGKGCLAVFINQKFTLLVIQQLTLYRIEPPRAIVSVKLKY